jgi:hypothetical protein
MKTNEFEDCDGALWALNETTEKNETVTELETMIYKYQDRKFKPGDLGYKYHVLTFKHDKSIAEVMAAYIGDVKFFIDNQAKAGYNGMMVKDKAIPKKEIKVMFKQILDNWEFPMKTINDVVKQV